MPSRAQSLRKLMNVLIRKQLWYRTKISTKTFACSLNSLVFSPIFPRASPSPWYNHPQMTLSTKAYKLSRKASKSLETQPLTTLHNTLFVAIPTKNFIPLIKRHLASPPYWSAHKISRTGGTDTFAQRSSQWLFWYQRGCHPSRSPLGSHRKP